MAWYWSDGRLEEALTQKFDGGNNLFVVWSIIIIVHVHNIFKNDGTEYY